MDYKKIYNNIISKRIYNEVDKNSYCEIHHILPRSLGGTNDPSNLIKLTAREHFICHYLLVKMYDKYTFEWYKMIHAFMMMKCSSTNHNRYFNSRLYEKVKRHAIRCMSIAQLGQNNSQYGTIWINNGEIARKISSIGKIPIGWNRGRILVQIPHLTPKLNKCKECFLLEKQQVSKEKALYWYKIYIKSECKSLNQFVKTSKYPHSAISLSKMFKTYIIGVNITQGKAFNLNKL